MWRNWQTRQAQDLVGVKSHGGSSPLIRTATQGLRATALSPFFVAPAKCTKGLDEARKVSLRSALMVCIGATIGKCGYCECDITMNQQINALTPFYGVFHKFVYYQMLTENFQRSVLLSSAQATLPIINKSKWSALTVMLPPKLEEQKRIAAKFEALRAQTQHLESIYQRKLVALDELKKSLLYQAFSGEL